MLRATMQGWYLKMQGSQVLRCHRCRRYSSPLTARRHYSRGFVKAASCNRGDIPTSMQVRYAIVGAGLAGIATAWQLLDAHQRMAEANPHKAAAVQVHVFEAYDIAAGGSGAAAGLLHPISPKGKILWRGEEAMQEALRLIAAAEAAQARSKDTSSSCIVEIHQLPSVKSQGAGHDTSDSLSKPFVWRTGMVRPAANQKQIADFVKVAKAQHSNQQAQQTMQTPVAVVDVSQLQSLVPGIQAPALANTDAAHEPQKQTNDAEVGPGTLNQDTKAHSGQHDVDSPGKLSRKQRRASKTGQLTPEEMLLHAGLHVTDGVVLNVSHYLTWLWNSCQQKAASLTPGSLAVMHRQHIKSLKELQAAVKHSQYPPASATSSSGASEYTSTNLPAVSTSDILPQGSDPITWNAIIVAAGAAACALPGLDSRLPLQLCQGYTLVLQPGCVNVSEEDQDMHTGQPLSYPPGSPSILGSTYLSAQGSHQLVVGATKAYGMTPEQALAECAPNARVFHTQDTDSLEANSDNQQLDTQKSTKHRDRAVEEAVVKLTTAASQVWPPINTWSVKEIRSGVRALPPITQAGSLPLLGRVPLYDQGGDSKLEGDADNAPPVWVIAGLGSRGLVYHAWLAKHIANAVVSGNDSCIPHELVAWQDLADFKTLVYDAA